MLPVGPLLPVVPLLTLVDTEAGVAPKTAPGHRPCTVLERCIARLVHGPLPYQRRSLCLGGGGWPGHEIHGQIFFGHLHRFDRKWPSRQRQCRCTHLGTPIYLIQTSFSRDILPHQDEISARHNVVLCLEQSNFCLYLPARCHPSRMVSAPN